MSRGISVNVQKPDSIDVYVELSSISKDGKPFFRLDSLPPFATSRTPHPKALKVTVEISDEIWEELLKANDWIVTG